MNFFFFINQQHEFKNYFPVAMEIKKKFNKSHIYFNEVALIKKNQPNLKKLFVIFKK